MTPLADEKKALAIPALLCGMLSFQTGASVAKALFPAYGPVGTVFLRVGIAALVMCVAVRPWRFRHGRHVWSFIVPYGVVLGSMNLSFYVALARLPLGPTVAIEFVGPLAVALSASRRPSDLAVLVLVVIGLVMLLGPDAASAHPDPLGVLAALGAGLCWALYILAGKRLGTRIDAASGAALGMAVAAVTVLPAGLTALGRIEARPDLLAAAAAVAVLSSALPYTLELFALRRLTTRVFGVLMSLEPAVAALAGLVMLGEHLTARRWAGIVCVVLASIASVIRRDPVPA